MPDRFVEPDEPVEAVPAENADSPPEEQRIFFRPIEAGDSPFTQPGRPFLAIGSAAISASEPKRSPSNGPSPQTLERLRKEQELLARKVPDAERLAVTRLMDTLRASVQADHTLPVARSQALDTAVLALSGLPANTYASAHAYAAALNALPGVEETVVTPVFRTMRTVRLTGRYYRAPFSLALPREGDDE